MKIRVAIVEDDKALRESLVDLIQIDDRFEFADAFSNGIAYCDNLEQTAADVVVLDISMPGINGLEVLRLCKEKKPGVQYLIHTIFDEEEKIFNALKAGATGYLLKGSSPSEIHQAIISINEGGSPMSAAIARKVVSSFSSNYNRIRQNENLTPREMEILQLLSKGLKYKEIGNNLSLSVDTIRSHIRHIYEKLQVNSKIEAINKVYPSQKE